MMVLGLMNYAISILRRVKNFEKEIHKQQINSAKISRVLYSEKEEKERTQSQ